MKTFCLIVLSIALVFSMCACAPISEEEPFIPEKGSDLISFDGVVSISSYSFPDSKSYRRTYSDPEIISKFTECIGNFTLSTDVEGNPGETNSFGIHVTYTYEDGHSLSMSVINSSFVSVHGSSQWYHITEENYSDFQHLFKYTPQLERGTMQILEQTGNAEETSYRIGAGVSGTDFSSTGAVLANEIREEWEKFDSMSPEQRMASSHAWGTVYVNSDTWEECEEAIGVPIQNPIESLDWLNKTGYFGDESADPNFPVTHVKTTATAMRELSRLSVTAGYNTEKISVTLTAILSADAGTLSTGVVTIGKATYEQNTATTGSGIPVLVMTTYKENNTGFYISNFFDPTAYWVKDNVFYKLRVSGDEINKVEIESTLNRILSEI